MVKFSSLSFLALLALVIYLAAANSFFLNPTICHKVITVLKALSELVGVTNHYFVARKGCSKTPYKRIAKKERKAVTSWRIFGIILFLLFMTECKP